MHNLPFRFDANRPCLVLAPPLEYPAHSGNLALERKWAEFSNYVSYVDIVSKNSITRYCQGQLESQVFYENFKIKKITAAILTLLHRSHYLIEKDITDDFRAMARRYLLKPEYNLIIFSYIWTATVMDEMQIRSDSFYCIETHNDELKWFDNIQKSIVNPVAKLASFFSKRWLFSFLTKHELDFIYLHVSQADHDGYLRAFPKHIGYVVPVGIDLPKNNLKGLPSLDRVRLIFVGSLSANMNLDALKVFRDEFYSVLRNALADQLEVVVVGSNPSRKVINICDKLGWKLHANVSDEKLEKLYGSATFSLLPFNYVTGRKLKILESLANGVPFLATANMAEQVDEVIYPCLVSDSPDAWLNRIVDVLNNGIDVEKRSNLRNYAMQYTWPTIANRLYRLFDSEFSNRK